jgi:hypothetical protein
VLGLPSRLLNFIHWINNKDAKNALFTSEGAKELNKHGKL